MNRLQADNSHEISSLISGKRVTIFVICCWRDWRIMSKQLKSKNTTLLNFLSKEKYRAMSYYWSKYTFTRILMPDEKSLYTY